jgi:N-acetylglucosamine-6-sulfatase
VRLGCIRLHVEDMPLSNSRFILESGVERQRQSDVSGEGIDAGIDRPSFLVVVTDDMRDSDWKALPKTWEAISSRGAVFPNCFLTTPVCSPSRTSILTGQYAHNHRVTQNTGKSGGFSQFKQRNLSEQTIVSRLRAIGYRTALFGKFMNGTDEKGGIPGGWDQWMATTERDYYKPVMNDNGKRREFKKNSEYATDILRVRAASFIRSTPAETPFFLCFTPKAPHGPSTPARRDRGRFGGARVERSPDVMEADISDKPRYVRQLRSKGLSKLDGLKRKRLGSLVAVDDAVSELIAMLDERGTLDNTYVFVMSDNGYAMGSHRLTTKGAPYRPITQVTMLASGPGIASGAIDNRIVANIDLAPTIAEAAGVDFSTGDGVSLLSSDRSDGVLLEAFGRSRAYKALRTRQYLYVENTSGERELYDYDRDPYELDNLLANWEGHTPSAEAEAIALDLKPRLNALRNCAGATCG